MIAFGSPPPVASAASFGCEASAVRGTLLSTAAIEPVVANRGAPACRTVAAGLNAPLPILLSASAVSANTAFAGPAGGETAAAAGGLTDVRVLALPQLPITLPTAQIADTLGSVTIPLTAALQLLLGPGVPLNLDLRPALQALLPNGQLPTAELLRVQGAMAYATATCAGSGTPQLSGRSSVAGISVLGQGLPVGPVVDQVLTLINSGSIDPSNIDLSKIVLPAPLSFATPVLGLVLQGLVKTVLDSLPTIAIPATLAQVKVTPGEQTRTADTLRQQALHVQVAIAGQSLVDLVVGEAIVRGAGACAAVDPGEAAAADLVLGCTTRRLVLTDVQERDGRVRLLGVADRSLAGRSVALRFTHSGKTVAHATVRPDGNFSATADLPAKRLRGTNDARYQAAVGSERSLALKLRRRMVISSARTTDGKVKLSGRVVGPLGRPVAQIVVSRRVSCKRSEVVRRVRPGKDGRYSVTVDAPEGELAAVYRLSTRVRKTTANAKTFPTFTLPRAISLT